MMRRHLPRPWTIVPLTVTVSLLAFYFGRSPPSFEEFIDDIRSYYSRERGNLTENYYKEVELAMKQIYKSHLIPFEPVEDLKSRNIFYNRIEKCGSRSLISIAMNIRRKNKFEVWKSVIYTDRRPSPEDLDAERETIDTMPPPTFYERHIFYFDFNDTYLHKPIYINLVRDPIERFVSMYNYEKYGDLAQKRSPPYPGRLNISECVLRDADPCAWGNLMMFNIGVYFCGMDEACLKSSSRKRVELAKKNIDKKYTFIGSLEEFNTTLLLLEKMFPHYFKGASDLWAGRHGALYSTLTKKNDLLTDAAWSKLRYRTMLHEYEVYHHALRKFQYLKAQFGLS